MQLLSVRCWWTFYVKVVAQVFASVAVYDGLMLTVNPVTSTHGISEPGRRSMVEMDADVGYSSSPSLPAAV